MLLNADSMDNLTQYEDVCFSGGKSTFDVSKGSKLYPIKKSLWLLQFMKFYFLFL